MEGQLLQGRDELIIRDIVTRAKNINSDTLYLDLHYEKSIHPKAFQKNFPYAIATDRPADFNGLPDNIILIRVADIKKAFWKFVGFYRNCFTIPVIGVTGTCGKTTTKEMIKHILSGWLKVNATYKSYNALFRNFGYLLNIDDQTQAAVFEMGVAYPGDIKTSCRYFKPQIGVITNIGIDHLQVFGTLDGYIKAKAEILEGLEYQGTLILNADDENISKIDLKNFKGKIIYFGFDDKAHFKVTNVIHEKLGISFTLQYAGCPYQVFIPGHGEFNVHNAAAAIAATHAVGLKIEPAAARLGSFQNVEKHFEFKKGINGSAIIDDTWSTNPTSAIAALKLLKSLADGKKTVAVLGKMSLLGKQSFKYHFETGAKVAQLGIDRLIVIGDGAEAIGHGALQQGMDQSKVHFCNDSATTYEVLKEVLDQNSIALVKTSMLASYSDLLKKIIIKN